jgi:hypothetical protein
MGDTLDRLFALAVVAGGAPTLRTSTRTQPHLTESAPESVVSRRMGTARWRRLTFTAVSAFALLLLFTQSAFADLRDFTLRNRSDVDIAYVYVSPSAADEWGDDIMGVDILPAGESIDVTFDPSLDFTCVYDVKVVGTGGELGYLYKVDLCTVTTVTFT